MDNFKKIVVSLFVIESFIAYTYYEIIHKSTHTIITAEQKKVTDKITTLQITPTPTSTQLQPKNSLYKNGTYVGLPADAVYGNIQVQVTITYGLINKINFLQYPNDQETSIAINEQADPILTQEAIQAQSAQVDIISSATLSSKAFIQSLQNALAQAKTN